VHAFGSDAAENLADWDDFLSQLGAKPTPKGTVSGPAFSGLRTELPTYFLWWQESVRNA
jgi:hypothetical protein